MLFEQELSQEEIGCQHFVSSIAKVLKQLALQRKEELMAEKIKDHRRHIVTNTQGNLLHVKVHATNIHDSMAEVSVLETAFEKYSSILGVSANAGYRGTTESFIKSIGKFCSNCAYLYSYSMIDLLMKTGSKRCQGS